jgi:predicted enzyme related to lactoylglutathione lyase
MLNALPNSGEFCWNRLATADVNEAKRFYTALFGWEAFDVDMGTFIYTTFKLNNKNICGLLQRTGADNRSYWLSFIAVDDIEAAVSRAEKLGAKIEIPVTKVPNGKVAVILDTVGAYVGLREMEQAIK